MNTDGLIVVDVEATSRTPETGVMTEFGAVAVSDMDWFHGHLWDSHPDPGNPALPVADEPNYGFTHTNRGVPFRRIRATGAEAGVLRALASWLHARRGPGGRLVLVSDNPAFDFMWVACAFDRAGMENPFGFSARRIGDFAAGLERDWSRSSKWKALRRTKHDHNPVHDAKGNAEALLELLRRAER